MARITTVDKARKDQGICMQCGKPIERGMSYRWCRPNRFTHRRAWHVSCPQPRPSMLEGNERRAALMSAQEDAEDALNAIDYVAGSVSETIDRLREILSDTASQFRDVAEEYEESAQSIEDGFGHSTAQSEEAQEKAQMVEEAADLIENLEIPEPDENEEETEDDLQNWLEGVKEDLLAEINGVEIP